MTGMESRFLRAVAVAVVVFAVAGRLIMAQGNADAAKLKNPAASTPESIAAGQQLYARNCASCHGRNGQGGPGNDLIPAAPSLLGDAWSHGSTDGEIFTNIKSGVAPDFNMVPFKDKLKDDDIWNIVNYIRSIKK
jgi:mono/diheme cytochrome c family protein